jgi:hypothetical protein
MGNKSNPQVTTTQNTVDPMVSQMQQHTLDTARDVLDPYLKKPGYGVAAFNADQQNAFGQVRDLAGGITPGNIQSWMNPYVSNVVDTTTSRMQQEADRNLAAIRARGAAGSAFGGMGARSAFAENRATQGSQQQMAEMTAKLMAQGYDQATATAITNQGLKGQAAQAILGIGNQQQQLEQTKLDQPLMALDRLHKYTPQQYSSTQTTTTPPPQGPSPLQQALGIAGTLGGAFLGGPMGASLGGSLGSMLGGGIPGMAQGGYGPAIPPGYANGRVPTIYG